MGRLLHGKTRNQVLREGNQMFPGWSTPKETTPEVLDILSMQSMIPELYDPSTSADAPIKGPIEVQVIKLNAQTNLDKLKEAFLPRFRYDTPYPPHKMMLMDRCMTALSSPVFMMFQMQVMSALEQTQLRVALRKHSMDLFYVKQSILKRALRNEQVSALRDLWLLAKGPIIVAYSDREPSQLKGAMDAIDVSKKFILLSGSIEGQIATPRQCRHFIYNVPGRQELYSRICAMFTAPASRLCGSLRQPLSSMADALQARINQLSNGQ